MKIIKVQLSLEDDYFYAQEKLVLALHEITIGKGDLRSRFCSASIYLLSIQEADFPKELRHRWALFKKKITKNGPFMIPGIGVTQNPVQNTVMRKRNHTLQKYLLELISISEDLEIANSR